MTKIIAGLIVLILVAALGVWLYLVPVGDTNGGGELQKFSSENVRVNSPRINEKVEKKFAVTGEIRGNWMFEASFPIQVLDPSGNKVAQGFAMTSANWMTTEFVPFTGEITTAGYSGPATIVLMKDNPSGLPENDDSVSFTVVIK